MSFNLGSYLYGYPDSLSFALFAGRVWIAIMVFAHGWRHLKALKSGPGMANWFESLGIKPGPLHAWSVTLTELVFPALLVLGFFTPMAYGGVAALMFVAFMTNHLKNGFFLNTQTEGYEYVVTVGIVAMVLGTVGPGAWSLDNAVGFGFPFDPDLALFWSLLIGIGGAAAFLAAFWRPPKKAA